MITGIFYKITARVLLIILLVCMPLYGGKLKITRDNFTNMSKGYYQQYNINWMVDNGIFPKCVSSICEKYDIAHYAFDVKKMFQ